MAVIARAILVDQKARGPHTARAMLPKNSTRISASMAKPFLAFTGFSV